MIKMAKRQGDWERIREAGSNSGLQLGEEYAAHHMTAAQRLREGLPVAAGMTAGMLLGSAGGLPGMAAGGIAGQYLGYKAGRRMGFDYLRKTEEDPRFRGKHKKDRK